MSQDELAEHSLALSTQQIARSRHFYFIILQFELCASSWVKNDKNVKNVKQAKISLIHLHHRLSLLLLLSLTSLIFVISPISLTSAELLRKIGRHWSNF